MRILEKIRTELQKPIKPLEWFEQKRLFHYFMIYGLINLCFIIGYQMFVFWTGSVIDLKPVLPTETNWSLIGLAVAILPFSLLLEEFAFRVYPNVLLKLLRFKTEQGFGFVLYVVSAGVFAASIHQLNIVNADLIGRMIYFGIQLFSGLYFAYYYKKYGLVAVWILHTAWDYFLVSISIVQLLL